jgi:hypothetical protein
MALTRPLYNNLNTTVEVFSDPLTVLHGGATTANVDVGFIMNRANGLVSNVALYWNEAGNAFTTAFTTSTGSTDTNIAVTSYANITTGSLTVSGPILPSANIKYDIGSPTQRFRSIYLSGNTIDLAGAIFKTDATTGAIAIIPNPTALNPNPTGIVVSHTGAISTVSTTGGVLSANAISVSSNTATTTNTSTFANIVVNQSTSNVATSTSAVHVSGYDGTTVKVTTDSFGNVNAGAMFIGRRARNTGAVPTAVQQNDTLGAFIGRGWGATGFLLNSPAQSAGIVVVADQNFTDTAQGTRLNLQVTANNSNVATTAVSINNAGQVTTTSDLTVGGNLNVAGTVIFQNSVVETSTALVQGVEIVAGNLVANSGVSSSSTATGALVVQGGAGISGNLNVGGTLTVGSFTATNVYLDRGQDLNDWNTVTIMGTYLINRTSWSGTSNTPLNSQNFTGVLEVLNTGNVALTQNYRPYDNSGTPSVSWTRSKFSTNSWTGWVEILDGSEAMDGGSF